MNFFAHCMHTDKQNFKRNGGCHKIALQANKSYALNIKFRQDFRKYAAFKHFSLNSITWVLSSVNLPKRSLALLSNLVATVDYVLGTWCQENIWWGVVKFKNSKENWIYLTPCTSLSCAFLSRSISLRRF